MSQYLPFLCFSISPPYVRVPSLPMSQYLSSLCPSTSPPCVPVPPLPMFQYFPSPCCRSSSPPCCPSTSPPYVSVLPHPVSQYLPSLCFSTSPLPVVPVPPLPMSQYLLLTPELPISPTWSYCKASCFAMKYSWGGAGDSFTLRRQVCHAFSIVLIHYLLLHNDIIQHVTSTKQQQHAYSV